MTMHDTFVATLAEIEPVLRAHVDDDWSVPARDLDMSCHKTGVHLADTYLAEAAQITGTPDDDWVPIELIAPDNLAPARLVDAIMVMARIYAATANATDPSARAYHPWGNSDVEGYLAMGVVESLVHTFDIVAALGDDWRPPNALAAPALRRIFPAVGPDDERAGDLLLWATGRIGLPDRERLTSWRWHG
jgi:hypothetical protein